MQSTRLQKQISFLLEIDKMKTILRRNIILDKSKQEDDAEHSWHMAMMAMIRYEYAPKGTDLFRVLKIALVHDLVEVYAGDTFCYDQEANLDKAQREQQAADKLFSMLEEDQARELRTLWEEFDRMDTPDSLYAGAIDRLQPLLLNCHTQGHTWKLGPITSEDVYRRADPIRRSSPELWEYVDGMIQSCIQSGLLPK